MNSCNSSDITAIQIIKLKVHSREIRHLRIIYLLLKHKEIFQTGKSTSTSSSPYYPYTFETQGNISDYQEYFNIALDQEEEVQSLEEELERSKRLLSVSEHL